MKALISRFLYTSTRKDFIFRRLQSSESFVSYIESCPDIKSLVKLHACIIISGYENHIFLSSKLLNRYATFNSLTESNWVFNRIVNKNLSLWNSTLVGYFRTGFFDEVLKLYTNLKQQKIGIDSSALTFCLKSCTKLGRVDIGRQIHVDAFKFGVNSNKFVGSALIGLYFKCEEDTEDARKVFDEISEKDVVAYTAMVTGYAQHGGCQAYEAFRIVGYMQKNGFDPNRVTLVSLLQVAAQLEALKEGQSIHGFSIRREIGCFDEVFNTCLVDMYVKCGDPYAAESTFKRMSTKNVASWNALITGYIQIKQPLIALDLFRLMVLEDVMPDLITLSNLLGCAELEFLLQGKSIHAYILRSGVQIDLVAATALIDMYAKCDRIRLAKRLFDWIKTKDTILFNVMIAGYMRCKSPEKALETFYAMVRAGIRPNQATILSILSASSHLIDIKIGKSIHGYLVRRRLESSIEIANQILHMYAKGGSLDIARRVFDRIKNKDLVSWTSMMMGSVHHGYADETIQLFRLIQETRMEPDSVTLISLLQAFSQLGCLKSTKEIHSYLYQVHLANETPLLNSLATTYSKCGRLDMAELLFKHTERRDLMSWNTMIAAYGKHGNCTEALELFNRMQDEKVKPDEVTFTSLISACSHRGLVKEGQEVFRTMTVEHGIVPCEEHYGSMVDLFARAGQLQEAYGLVKCIPRERSSSALASLLAACRVYRDVEMSEIIGKQLVDIEPDSSRAYTLLANVYSEAGKWDEALKIREAAMSRSSRRQPGYSMIELDKLVCQK